jgi:hypothetical protein
MKKTLLLVVPVLVLLTFVSPAFARSHRHQTNQTNPAPTPTSTPSPAPAPAPMPVSTSSIQWGAFTGGSIASLNTFTETVGKQPNVVGVFIGDGSSFKDTFSSFYGLGNASQTLLVYWESNLTAKQIANGAADSFVTGWAADIKAYGHPVILSVLDEMNLAESKYTGDPTDYKAAWIRVHNLFAGVPNVKFAYVVNNDSSPNIPANSLTSYYPGDAYVDIVGIDGFNGYLAWGGPSKTWSQVFVTDQNAAIPTLKAAYPTKPLWIMSTGSCQGAGKPQFISDTGAGAKQYGLAGFVFFDVNKECDWRVEADPASLAAFKGLIQ